MKKWFKLTAMIAMTVTPGLAATQSEPAKAGVTGLGAQVAGRPFTPAVRAGDTLYLSGQLGTAADGALPADFETQARNVMVNVGKAASLGGATMDDLVKCTVMLSDMKLWPKFNEIYATYFKADRLPARSAFGTNGLALGALVEVECIAYKPQ
ncbi:hypothetical protein C1T17_05840 [Sphingobium sp. SCG-1]|uniref:RidA family protein n=1 Tax=Sphingobium sp. SCG-1 TaxID=2072936 RepID=UPI000CD6A608|nr:RidA family protein [Sphingobium sp. SCG-1]AUW57696.1 hypothetical protein C1T17_05840 [Sphingobium sp. SCG-1]